MTWVRDSGFLSLGFVTTEGTATFTARVGGEWEEVWSEYSDLPSGEYSAREGLEIHLSVCDHGEIECDDPVDVVVILARYRVRVAGPMVTILGDVTRWARRT